MSKRIRKNPKAVDRDVTREELAAELDVHSETIVKYNREGAPKERRGSKNFYNVAEYRAWMKANGRTGKDGRPAEGDSADLDAAKLRKENALAAKYELQVQRERGLLVPISEVKQWIGEHVTSAKNKFIGLGASIAPLLDGRDGAERQMIIDVRINEILNELAAA